MLRFRYASIRRVAVIDRHVVFERLCRRPARVLEWPLREGLEVEHAGVAPPARLVLLDGEKRARLLESLRIDERRQPLPRFSHPADGLDPSTVPGRQLVPQRTTRRHLVIPRNVMEPQEVLLRYAGEAVEAVADRRRVLADRVAARRRAIEPDAHGVGAMVIDGR